MQVFLKLAISINELPLTPTISPTTFLLSSLASFIFSVIYYAQLLHH